MKKKNIGESSLPILWREIKKYVDGKSMQGEKGEPGEAGYTPVKGTDYWTEADKAEMVNDVLAALPTTEGVNY